MLQLITMFDDFKDEFKDLDQNRFQFIGDIGSGTDGVLGLFNDKLKQRKIAIKLLKENCRKKEILNEIFNMRNLKHKNIISILQVILKRLYIEEEKKYILKIYYVMPYWPRDLRSLLREYKIENKKFTIEQIRKILYQILKAFNYLCQKVCLHRDIKPNNILIQENTQDNTFNACITDFGRSIIVDSDGDQKTIYVFVRYYRSPEIYILEKYDTKSEIWALGWIFYELIQLEHPLQKAKNREQLLGLIFELFGTPSQDYINLIQKGDKRIQYFEEIQKIEQRKISSQIKDFDQDGLDLLDKMLCFDYRQRICVQEALMHPFFKKLSKKKIQKSFEKIQSPFANMKYQEDIDLNLIVNEANLLNKQNDEKCDYEFDKLSIVEQEEENSYYSDYESENTNTTE